MSKIKYLSCIYNNLSDEYDDERLILNIKDLSKIDSILTIYKINQTFNKAPIFLNMHSNINEID